MAEAKEYLVQSKENGTVMISEEVIASIAALAVRDVEGVYEDYADKNSLISKLNLKEAKALAQKTQGGMLVKLNSCVEACENGVKKVHILDGRVKHSLLLEIFTDKGIGTLIG